MKIHSFFAKRRFLRNCDGAMTIEMSLVAVSVFFTIPVLIDVTSAINSGLTLSSGLRAGTQIALVQPSNTTAIAEAIAVSSGFNEDDVDVDTTTFCECSGQTVSCGTTSCSGGSTPATYMTITASYQAPTILEYPEPNPFEITKSNTIRVR